MISKPVAAHSFYHTCRYVCERQEAEVLLAEGVRGHDYKLMAEDFVRQQQVRPSKQMACFHSILSFYPGEKPSDETMKEIAQKYLEQLGIVNTQYAVTKHTDKAHLHLHIVANMVNNDGKSISDSYIGLRGKKIAQRLTQEYQLIPALRKNLELTHLESLNETEANKYKIYMAIAEILPQCRDMQDLESRLSKLGIETQYKYKGQTQEKQGVSFRIGSFCFKGSQIDRKFSLAGLEKTLALQQKLVMDQAGELEEKVEKQTEKENPRMVFRKIAQQKNTASGNKGESYLDSIGKDLANNATKELGKIVADLMKPEETNESMPYEFSYEAYKRRQKKNSHKPKR